jgi:hypothetical protein
MKKFSQNPLGLHIASAIHPTSFLHTLHRHTPLRHTLHTQQSPRKELHNRQHFVAIRGHAVARFSVAFDFHVLEDFLQLFFTGRRYGGLLRACAY